MVPRDKTGKKSNKQIKQEILEDWADVRRWIDELQQQWSKRHETARSEDGKRRTQPNK